MTACRCYKNHQHSTTYKQQRGYHYKKGSEYSAVCAFNFEPRGFGKRRINKKEQQGKHDRESDLCHHIRTFHHAFRNSDEHFFTKFFHENHCLQSFAGKIRHKNTKISPQITIFATIHRQQQHFFVQANMNGYFCESFFNHRYENHWNRMCTS